MNVDVRRFLTSLNGAQDVNSHYREIERWVAEGGYERLDEVIAALTPLISESPHDRWQFRVILDQIRRQLAMNPGPSNLSLLLKQLAHEGMPSGHLREAAAQFADSQEPEVIVAALEEYETQQDFAEFMNVLAHEAVLRRKLDELIPIAQRLAARMLHQGHPLGGLPLRLYDLEAEAPAYLRHYSSYGSTNASASTSGGREEDRADASARIEPAPEYREIGNTDRAERVIASIGTWLDGSNGRFEVRFFEFQEPLPIVRIRPSLLRSLGLECLSEVGEERINVKSVTAAEIYGSLFSASANGGAYTSGEGGAYGRLAAWQSLAALIGCTSGEVERIADHGRMCSWISFQAHGGWFYDVAWDIGLAVLDQAGKSLTIFAATDTD